MTDSATAMKNAPVHKPRPMVELPVGIVIPSVILMKFSGNDAFGATTVLDVGKIKQQHRTRVDCGHESVRPLDVREALLRLAGQSECPIEVVEQSDALISLGGVGCLLRTRLPAQIDTRTATACG